ncbi:MAG: class I SAM-dependent methyltransferase [Candidatus Nanoarchaeia archaeon]|jgi:ubiquinone/menaquinone biosynthesis C-methylase UbiE
MDLKNVYDSIAVSWDNFRKKPLSFVTDFIKQHDGLLLDAGCGSGRHALSNKLVGTDFSFEMIKLARKKINDSLVADVRALPFKNKVFDNSVCISVLHHLKPTECLVALRELERVTNNELLISVWLHESLRGEQYIKWGDNKRYFYFYEPKEFELLIRKVFKKVKFIPDTMNQVLLVSN